MAFDASNEGRPPWFDRSDDGGPPNSNPAFRIVQAVVIGTILFWLGIGIRQWFVFSKGLKSTSSTKASRKRSMKSWIMMVTKTKQIKDKDNSRYILALSSDWECIEA
jgi:hypothetical protein